MYSINEQIIDALTDLEDDQESLRLAEVDLVEAQRWLDKMKGWVAKDEEKLEKLRKEEEELKK